MYKLRLFSYGANMDISTLHERHIKYINYRVGILKDYQFKFNKPTINKLNSFANINPRIGSQVEGIISTITIETLKLLDIYEGYPKHYQREKVSVIDYKTKKTLSAIVYIANSKTVIDGLFPTEQYYDKIIRGRNFIRELKQKKFLKK